MAEKRITLKDIARECGVTPTLVSAVLNGRSKNILCAPKRREEIRATAERLGYRPNVLARSMTGKSIPIVALLLHFDRADAEAAANSYVVRCMTGMAFAFNEHNLEMLFIPYSTEEEQIRRIDNLYKNSLIGAVITNILPDSHAQLCAYLRNSRLPYMVLGAPLVPEVYCTYLTQKYLFDRLIRLAKERGLARAALITLQSGEPFLYELPLLHDYVWHTAPETLDRYARKMSSTLFAVMGLPVVNRLKEEGVVLPHTILVENADSAPLMPPDREVLQVRESMIEPSIRYTEQVIRNWMESGSPPAGFEKVFTDRPDDIVLQPGGPAT